MGVHLVSFIESETSTGFMHLIRMLKAPLVKFVEYVKYVKYVEYVEYVEYVHVTITLCYPQFKGVSRLVQ